MFLRVFCKLFEMTDLLVQLDRTERLWADERVLGGETVSDIPAARVMCRRTDRSGFRRVYSGMEMDVIACTRLRWRGDRGIA